MKCNSCQEHISPKMKKAVEKNLCPFCGDKIVPDELRKSLVILDSTMEFLLNKFEAETYDYIKDKYSLVQKSLNNQPAKRIQKEDEDSDQSEPEDENLSLTEKLKDKEFRKKYLLASKISGKAAVSNSDYETVLNPKQASYQEDEPRSRYADDEPDDGVDDGVLRKLQQMANKKAGNSSKSSDMEKLEEMMAKTRKTFIPPS